MGGAPGQSIFGTKFPNVSNENMQMFDKARVLADESTGFPSLHMVRQALQGVGRTASGISMLMSAANNSIRTVVKNVDDYLLGPLGRAFFHFNMQFDFDTEIKGDLEVKAEGTESLWLTKFVVKDLCSFLVLYKIQYLHLLQKWIILYVRLLSQWILIQTKLETQCRMLQCKLRF